MVLNSSDEIVLLYDGFEKLTPGVFYKEFSSYDDHQIISCICQENGLQCMRIGNKRDYPMNKINLILLNICHSNCHEICHIN